MDPRVNPRRCGGSPGGDECGFASAELIRSEQALADVLSSTPAATLKGARHARRRRRYTGAAWFLRHQPCSTSRAIERLQAVPRPAKSLHGELRRTDMQDRVRPVHEILPAKIAGA